MLKKLLITGTALISLAGCKEYPDAYRCVQVDVDNEGLSLPIDQWYRYCTNVKTQHAIRIPIQNWNKCIRDQEKYCRQVSTDINEYNILENWYKNNK